jgi:nitrate reductase NapAB chaperone NapD
MSINSRVHFSGLLILTKPGSVQTCADELSSCAGFDVYAVDADTGRIVAVLETETVEEQESGLRWAQTRPHVISAELVYHYFGDADDLENTPPTEEKS